jgi:hypothetical protein
MLRTTAYILILISFYYKFSYNEFSEIYTIITKKMDKNIKSGIGAIAYPVVWVVSFPFVLLFGPIYYASKHNSWLILAYPYLPLVISGLFPSAG